jgi:hypothetical protein
MVFLTALKTNKIIKEKKESIISNLLIKYDCFYEVYKISRTIKQIR